MKNETIVTPCNSIFSASPTRDLHVCLFLRLDQEMEIMGTQKYTAMSRINLSFVSVWSNLGTFQDSVLLHNSVAMPLLLGIF